MQGLKRTIACMDEEHPRTHSSINIRSQLRQILHIEDLYRKNKVQSSPLRTLLEIIIRHHIEGAKDDKMACNESEWLTSALIISRVSPAKTSLQMNDTNTERAASVLSCEHTELRSHVSDVSPTPSDADMKGGSWVDASVNEKGQSKAEHFVVGEPEKKPPEIIRSRPHRIRRGMLAGPIASTLQESNKQRLSRRVAAPQLLPRKEEDTTQSRDGLSVTRLHQKGSEKSSSDTTQRVQASEKVGDTTPGRHDRTIVRPKTQPHAQHLSVMVLDDVDDDLPELSNMSMKTGSAAARGHPMDQHTASELKAVLLGSCAKCFSVEWRNQAFTFSETHDLRYGIVQKKGGPCGVLASIQAFVLKKLLLESTDSANTRLQSLRPTNAARRKCLSLAVAEVLWRAGEEKEATVAINTGRNVFTPSGHYKCEGVLEKVTCFTVDSMTELQVLVEQHVDQFETGELGCLLLTVSAVLSRSIAKVREDMDVATTALIGAHGYCTQELVNLLLVGQAVSNVFDGNVELDPGKGNSTLLKGIKGPCNVGLLSLFEHYNIFKVGDYLKNPRFPVWVVCSESHFSVLFGLQGGLLTNQDEKQLAFDLYYYDGLANQQEEIRLTISVGKWTESREDADADLIPPLELCIRTRWKDALVAWNDTEPIL
ncbi:probable ubiquitin carboxyl-terminal hydrolase MINDY-4 isoform X2 [Dunckerocampus dactyliophorus]|uniref:probable ubiquitin carboxyl-terminal hydrolase MINDY-4 isoform X2 n=1 Tax=Dunckerocampus dactyliophorus TaxID=161453 RepID=UPI00240537D0|nr:probable ubiquitin carboxyl-terminal hydrolase MINDY-4 isoform X2 [Dunckerocampus dactyliophorus]